MPQVVDPPGQRGKVSVVDGQRLWERESQLRAAEALLAGAQEGRGGALFLLGDAGMGKTAVLEEVCRRAGEDVLVASGRCDPMEISLPYGLLFQLQASLGGRYDSPPTLRGETETRSTILYGTLRWLEEVAHRPLLIAIDDLQWTDPDSLVLLGFLCRRLARLPVAVIVTLRPWPAAAVDLASTLVPRGDATIEHLLALTEEAAAAVLGETLSGPIPPDVVGHAWRLTGGNPLLLGLAARALSTDGALSEVNENLPFSVVERALVLARFAGLGPTGRRWVHAASVLGMEFRPELVGEVAGLEGQAADVAAEAVWRSGLARGSRNGAAEFIHPLFGQLLYEDIPPPIRAHLHARAFGALSARGLDDLAAEHAIRANMVGDDKAIQVLIETGRRALRAGAPATAVSRLKAAVRLSGDTAPAHLPGELGLALYEAGHAAEAAATITQLLETDVPAAQRVAALTVLSRAHFSLGDFGSAGSALESAVVLAQRDRPQDVVVPLCRHADAVMMTAGPAAALPLAARARELAGGGTQRLQAQATAKWGALAYFSGDVAGLTSVDSAGRHLLTASRAELAADLRSGGSGVLVPFAIAAAPAEHFDEAETAFRIGIDEAERLGAVTSAAALRVPYGLMLLRVRPRDTLAVADRLLAIADLVPLAEPFARTMRSYAFLEMGDERQSAMESERARPIAAGFGIWLSLLWLDHVQGLRYLRHGRSEEASALYAELEARYHALGIGEPCLIPFARHAVVAHVRAGRTGDADRVTAWLDGCAARLPCRWPVAAAAAGRASLALRRGDLAEADTGYQRAVGLLEGVPLPLEQVELVIEHATMLRRDGRPREARESLKRAGELAESVGAIWLARRAGEELAAAGGRRRSRRGAQELTPREQAIARLAATGATDKDIATHLAVSVRTVRTHLEHVYAKLAIHSRRELMAMGERLEALIGQR
jgi:DNA-binding CsgD family transcriptional regulator